MEDEAADCLRRFECMTGVEIAVHGDDSRILLARRVIEQHEEIWRKAIRLLESFMRDSGTFDLSSIEVFPAKD
jgi:hypothetical protein